MITMSNKIKYTFNELLEEHENEGVNGGEVFYKKRIVPFIRQVTEDDIIDRIEKSNLSNKTAVTELIKRGY